MTELSDKSRRDEPAIDERQLDEYLRGNSSVSHQYRQLHDVEVPADLDRRVLRQAHDAVKRRSSQRPAWVRWSAPLAVAASAVLALAIVIETGVRDETMVASEPQPVMQAEKFARGNDEQESAAESAAPQHQTPSPQRVRPAAPAEEKETQEVIARSRRPAPPPVAAPVNAPAAPPAAAAPPTDQPAAAAEPPPALADSLAAPADASEPGYSLAKSAQTAARVLQTSARVDDARDRREADLSRTYTDPEEWLKDIRQLRKDNQQAQADFEWHRFRATFPDHEVAEDDTARAAKQ